MTQSHMPGRGRERLRASMAVGVLLILTVAVPAGLLALGLLLPVKATGLPDRLTRSDDGSLFLLALFGVAWLSWLIFAASLGLELVAILRGVPTPLLPGISAVQRIAASLVAGATLLIGSTGANAPPPAARPVAAVQLVEPEQNRMSPSAAEMSVVDEVRQSGPVVTVQRHDTLWSLAEQHLGSGERFRDILRLNLGVLQADGRRLTDSRWIYPGWQLVLPTAAGVAGVADYVVRPGDSLTRIAREELGGAASTDELFRLNQGRRQPDHRVLTDPDLIRPGWHLALRADAPMAPLVDPGASLAVVPAPTMPAEASSASRAVVAPEVVPQDSNSTVLAGAGLGLGVITATGLVLELRRRRHSQQRTRTAGARIPMPSSEAARIERVAAVIASPITLTTATEALRALAHNCHEAGRQLPDVLLLRLSESSLRLQLTSPDDVVVSPFILDEDGMWRLNEPPTERRQEDPYPALLTLGADDAEMLLLNLEAVGTLSVDDAVGDVWRAVVADLCIGGLAQTATATLLGNPQLVAASDPLRCRSIRDDEQLRREMNARLHAVNELLTAPQDVRHARSMSPGLEGLLPEVFAAEGHDLPGDVPPWAGACLIRRGSGTPASWRLQVEQDGHAVLQPLGVTFTAQALTTDDLERLVSVLGIAHAEPPEVVVEERAEREAVSLSLPEVPVGVLDLREGKDLPPRVLVLGRVEVERVNDAAAPHRRRRATELVAYLMLHSGATGREIDEALWPGKRVEKTTRNPFISRARQWLGRGADGQPFLPLVADGGSYRLSPDVSCDWHDFVRFAQLGLDSGPQGVTALAAALDLVRGRPFLGVDPATYTWAEADTQDMISAIVDVAHVLAEARIQSGDFRGAQQAVAKGLLAEPCSELLFRDAMRVALAVGDAEELERLTARLRNEIALVDPDETLDDETIELLAGQPG